MGILITMTFFEKFTWQQSFQSWRSLARGCEANKIFKYGVGPFNFCVESGYEHGLGCDCCRWQQLISSLAVFPTLVIGTVFQTMTPHLWTTRDWNLDCTMQESRWASAISSHWSSFEHGRVVGGFWRLASHSRVVSFSCERDEKEWLNFLIFRNSLEI